MIVDFLDQLIGPLPYYATAQNPQQYYEIIRYVIAGTVLLFMLSMMYRLFVAVFGRWLR